jgi:hypothetical protein
LYSWALAIVVNNTTAKNKIIFFILIFFVLILNVLGFILCLPTVSIRIVRD